MVLKTLFFVWLSLVITTASVKAQDKVTDYAEEDSTCIKVKPTIKMEGGRETRILVLINSCDKIFDIQIYKQNETGHWFSSSYESMEPGDHIRTATSLSGKYVIYKRPAGGKTAFPSPSEIEKKYN